MTRRLKPIALAIVCVALGAAIQRAYDTRQTIGRQLATRTQESNPPTTARAVPLPAPPWDSRGSRPVEGRLLEAAIVGVGRGRSAEV